MIELEQTAKARKERKTINKEIAQKRQTKTKSCPTSVGGSRVAMARFSLCLGVLGVLTTADIFIHGCISQQHLQGRC